MELKHHSVSQECLYSSFLQRATGCERGELALPSRFLASKVCFSCKLDACLKRKVDIVRNLKIEKNKINKNHPQKRKQPEFIMSPIITAWTALHQTNAEIHAMKTQPGQAS